MAPCFQWVLRRRYFPVVLLLPVRQDGPVAPEARVLPCRLSGQDSQCHLSYPGVPEGPDHLLARRDRAHNRGDHMDYYNNLNYNDNYIDSYIKHPLYLLTKVNQMQKNSNISESKILNSEF